MNFPASTVEEAISPPFTHLFQYSLSIKRVCSFHLSGFYHRTSGPIDIHFMCDNYDLTLFSFVETYLSTEKYINLL